MAVGTDGAALVVLGALFFSPDAGPDPVSQNSMDGF